MGAHLFNRNGRIRVWAMTPTYRDHYISLEVVSAGMMTTQELNNLMHDITSAQRVVAGVKTK